jgi:phosphoheptose isomerase
LALAKKAKNNSKSSVESRRFSNELVGHYVKKAAACPAIQRCC